LFTVVVSYRYKHGMDIRAIDKTVCRLIGTRKRYDSGAGFGYRDLLFDFASKEPAFAFYRKAKAFAKAAGRAFRVQLTGGSPDWHKSKFLRRAALDRKPRKR
jgi:hypothetical protein